MNSFEFSKNFDLNNNISYEFLSIITFVTIPQFAE